MMNKLASDAYSQGAYEALAQLNLPGHIKQAAAQYLVKEAEQVSFGHIGPSPFGEVAAHTPKPGDFGYVPPQQAAAEAEATAKLTKMQRLKALAGKLPKSLAGRSALGAGILGLGGATAYGLGAFDEDDFLTRAQEGDLSNAEIAALAGGTAALGAGGAYAAGLI